MNTIETISEKEILLTDMTNDEWQERFAIFRRKAEKSKTRNMRVPRSPLIRDITKWQSYCFYINDVLNTIRNGDSDYCYHMCQIEDLLRFEPTDLEAEWLPEYRCFRVYLRNSNNLFACT